MSFNDFTLLPADDPQSSASDDLAGAVQGALAIPDQVTPAPDDPQQPLGNSWDFDWETGQFRRAGTAPVPIGGLDAVAQWCLMAIHTARYAHPTFSDEFGMEEPDDVIGTFPVGEALSDWQRALVDALMVHDRITAVQNVNLSWDPSTGILTVLSLDVITDEDDTVTIRDVTLQAGGP